MAKSGTNGSSGISILVIDDDERMRDSLREALSRRGYTVSTSRDGPTGLACIREEEIDLVICDLRMNGMSGLEVCEKITAAGNQSPPVIVITAYGSVETAVRAMKLGAFDYITKPFKTDELQMVMERALRHRKLVRENQFLRSELEGSPDRFPIVGESPAIRKTLDLIGRYASSSATVLIRGESGTGKELVARAIHFQSSRRDRPFLCVNCAALSAGLLESELFGHEKGAFTGADRMRQGRFELADGGSILLDEVSEIDPRLQAKLLRVLQERTFERVGSSRSMQVDVRVLATSNRELEREVREGKFREDLFFRLNILPLEVPPLRARKEDIPLLAAHFLEMNRKKQGGAPRRVTPGALEILTSYPWPGNVRELENVMERAWVLVDQTELGPPAFPGIADPRAGPIPSPSADDPGHLAGLSIEEVERVMIRDALRRYSGHQKRTAAELGIGVRTLRTKIKKWSLENEGRRREMRVFEGVQ